MKNIEKYNEEIKRIIKRKEKLCATFIAPIILKHFNISCREIGCATCSILRLLWANEEYKEPEIYWSKVPVDTPIYVRDEEDKEWLPRHFAKCEDGRVYTWDDGRTSHTSPGGSMYSWEFAKLAEPKEEDNYEK